MQAMANAGRIIDLLNSKKDMHKQTNVQTSGMIARGKETGRNTNNTNKNHNALSTRMNSIAFNPIRTNFRCFADMVFPLETSRFLYSLVQSALGTRSPKKTAIGKRRAISIITKVSAPTANQMSGDHPARTP